MFVFAGVCEFTSNHGIQGKPANRGIQSKHGKQEIWGFPSKSLLREKSQAGLHVK
jgi:hypothetical protein